MPNTSKDHTLITRGSCSSVAILVCVAYIFHPVKCETNLALGKKTGMSSAVSSRTSDRAVDGNFDNNIEQGSCAQTSNQGRDQYWYVDLGETFTVSSINITMRAGCCDSQLETATIYVTNNSYSQPTPDIYKATEKCWNIKDLYLNGIPRGQTVKITCSSPVVGRFVYIQNRGSSGISLCEVQVYGSQDSKTTAKTSTSSTRATTSSATTSTARASPSTTTKSTPSTTASTPKPTSAKPTPTPTPSTTTKSTRAISHTVTTKSTERPRPSSTPELKPTRATPSPATKSVSSDATSFTTRQTTTAISSTASNRSESLMQTGLVIAIAVMAPMALLFLVVLIIVGLKLRRKKHKAKPEHSHQPDSGVKKETSKRQIIKPEYSTVTETNHVQGSSPGDKNKNQAGKAVLVLDGKVADIYAHVNKDKKGKSAHIVNAPADDIADLYAVPDKTKKKNKAGQGDKDKNDKSTHINNAPADDIADLYAVPDKTKKKNKAVDGQGDNLKPSKPAPAPKKPGLLQKVKSKQTTDKEEIALLPKNVTDEDTSEEEQVTDVDYVNTEYVQGQKNSKGSSEKENNDPEVGENAPVADPRTSDEEATEKNTENKTQREEKSPDNAESAENEGPKNNVHNDIEAEEHAEGTDNTYYNLGPVTRREEDNETNLYANM